MPPSDLGRLAGAANLEALVDACEPRIVRWQWASADLWSPEPWYFERNQYSRGRALAKQPAVTKDAKLYGHDATGAVVRIRSWSGFLKRWHEEELFVPGDGELIGYRFRIDGTLMNVHRYSHDPDGLLLEHVVYFAGAKRTGSQRFVWRDDLLERVDVTDWGHGWALEWDALGQLLAIAQVSGGKRSEIYRRPPSGETLAGLLAVVRARLGAVIPPIVAGVRPASAACALAIVVDAEEWRYMLPPSLALVFEDDRTRTHAAHPGTVRDVLWNPAELPMFDVPELELTDARLVAACERANQHLQTKGAQGKVVPLLRGLARELQALDWRALRPVSDDFFVYVTSLEADGWRDARRDAPVAIRQRLVKRGEL